MKLTELSRNLFSTLFLTAIVFNLYSNTYYVSSTLGSDNNDGLSLEYPFKSISKLNTLTFYPGDKILFKSGDIFDGMFWIKGSGTAETAIAINSYGGVEKPIINGNGYQSCILIYNDEYIDIGNLELTNEASYLNSLGEAKKINGFVGASNDWGSGKNVRFGIKIVGDSKSLQNFKINNLFIHDIYPTPTNENYTHQGYAIKLETNSVDSISLFNTISNVEITNVNISKTGHYGIWIKSLGLSEIDAIKNDNISIEDCNFEHTGGSGFVPNKSQNILVENCTFNHSGSGIDPRMWNRGSGMWTFKCKNVVAQHNNFLNCQGPQDSYSCHIDYGNENVVFQYNYSHNNEGGFAEILGNNINCGYRYNISVNDGYRVDPNGASWDRKGKIFWVSNYCGSNLRCPSTGTFIYNNTVFVNDTLNPEIYFWPNIGDVYLYNNLVYVGSNGDQIPTLIQNTSNTLNISHNLFYDPSRINLDNDLTNNAVYDDPLLLNQSPLGIDNPFFYRLKSNSSALNSGKLINGSANVTDYLNNNGGRDYFGNPVSDIDLPNIGAYNGNPDLVYIPDDSFEQYLEANAMGDGIDNNNFVLTSNIANITYLDVNNLGISSLEGIQYFTDLTYLFCQNNFLNAIDVTQNIKLESINCRYNQITSLDVSKSISLVSLICNDNLLTAIDLSQNIELQQLGCEDNQLTAIDVSNNTYLKYFICGDNLIENLDISNNTSLSYLGCHANQLTFLDVSNNNLLEVLSFGDNELTSIDLSNLNLLSEFRCYGNQLSCIKLNNGNNTNISIFDATNNPDLECIEVDDPNWSLDNWVNIDSATTFSTNCSNSSSCF